MSTTPKTILVDQSGAGSAGISQYINQITSRVSSEYRLLPTGRHGNKIVRTAHSIWQSFISKPKIFWAVAPSFAIRFSRAQHKVLTVHDLRPFLDASGDSVIVTLYRKIAFTQAIKAADQIICVSHRTFDDVKQLFPNSITKLTVIALSGERANVTSNVVLQADADGGSSQVPKVAVIAHEHNKQAHRLLAVTELLKAEVVFNFLFGNHAPSWMNQLVEKENVIVSGFLSDEEYIASLSQASAVIMLSNFEGFGIPIVEAQRLQVPVVISDDRALLEVASSDAQVVFKEDSSEEIVQKILSAVRLKCNPITAGKYDLRTWDDVASETLTIFNQVTPAQKFLVS